MYSVLGRIATIAHLNDIIENGGSSSPYSSESYSGPDREEMTFWVKRKVLGGNSSLAGTPDGLAGPAIAVADFFTEDFVTLISQDATAGERGLALALLIPIVKPLRLLKPLDDVMSGGKTVGKGTGEIDKVLTKNGAFRDVKSRAGIPNSTQHKKPVDVYDGTTENRRVYEFEVDGKKKYIIEHQEDKFGRGPHFHGADDLKGNPLEKGKYNQYPGHSPENFVGYKKKGRP
ncbi:HNH/endonuclease VII fold putative polymorphic toxin [Oceanobacillus sp. FSL H7-0719]|uniref:HNH/endonuclease VII fold putative polymorphic toxin n=1 Tax=Oceanobacillus sp. FSL H7-0719 TaxID=2954507 RepID=UPI003255B832